MGSVQFFLHLVRHAETAWAKSGQHTSITDIPLTELGKRQAAQLKVPLSHIPSPHVFCSPLQRAKQTCRLAGFQGTVEPLLTEWNYGEYEGLTSLQLPSTWDLFKEGAPGGESPTDVEERAKSLLSKFMHYQGHVIVFSHGHFLRALAMTWLNLPFFAGQQFILSPASVSTLTYNKQKPAMQRWNETCHLDVETFHTATKI